MSRDKFTQQGMRRFELEEALAASGLPYSQIGKELSAFEGPSPLDLHRLRFEIRRTSGEYIRRADLA